MLKMYILGNLLIYNLLLCYLLYLHAKIIKFNKIKITTEKFVEHKYAIAYAPNDVENNNFFVFKHILINVITYYIYIFLNLLFSYLDAKVFN